MASMPSSTPSSSAQSPAADDNRSPTLVTSSLFFVPYATGYAVFLSTTIIVAIAFALFWGYYARRHDTWASRRQSSWQQWTRHCWNAVLMLSFEASVALLTWTGSIYSITYDQAMNSDSSTATTTGEEQQEQGPVLGLAGILIGTLLLWIPLACLTDFLYIRVGSSSNTRTTCVLFGVFLITTLSVLPGFTMLTVYCQQMTSIEDYTYYGPMIVTDLVSVESLHMRGHFAQLRRRTGDDDSDSDNFIHIAKPTVLWGLDWGCPDQPTTWCSGTSVYEPECVRCEGRTREQGFACTGLGTRDDAKQCVLDKYGINQQQKEENQAAGIMDHDDVVDPTIASQVSEWGGEQEQQEGVPGLVPSSYSNKRLYMYGNCQNCNVMVAQSYDYLIRHNQSLKRTGIALEIFALALYGGLFLWVFVSDQLAKNHGDEEESSATRGTEAAALEEQEPSSNNSLAENGAATSPTPSSSMGEQEEGAEEARSGNALVSQSEMNG